MNFSALELANNGPSEKLEVQKWGLSFSNIQPNSETMESVELGRSHNRIISFLKHIKHYFIILGCILFGIAFIIAFFTYVYHFSLFILRLAGVDGTEKYGITGYGVLEPAIRI